MSYLPAGYSDDESDEYEFSFGVGDNDISTKTTNMYVPDPKQDIEDKIYTAILDGDLIALQHALDNNLGIDVNSPLRGSWTPLLSACSYAKLYVVKYVLKQKADPKKHIGMHTPLMAACSSNTQDEVRADIVECLLDAGAEVNRCNAYGNTPLMMACDNGLEQVVRVMLHKAMVDVEDNKGWTALFYAINGNHYKLCSLLMEKNCLLDQADIRGLTPLMLAESKGFTEIVELLETSGLGKPKHDIWQDVKHMVESKTWKDVVPGKKYCGSNEPCYYDEVAQLLYGMDLEHLTPIFLREKISLKKFLCLNDELLERIGVFLPFQRKRILECLDMFHMRAWSSTSITLPKQNENFDTFDLLMQLAAHYKHILVMESTFIYINQRLGDEAMKSQLSSSENQTIATWFSSKQTNELELQYNQLEDSIKDFRTDLQNIQKTFQKISTNLPRSVDLVSPFYYDEIIKQKFNWKSAFVSYICIPTALLFIVKKIL